MSDTDAKIKRSTRLSRNENAIKKQVRIAKEHGLGYNDKVIKEPHRLVKHRAMDCGNPECAICGNPRHIYKHGETIQEKSFNQRKLHDEE